MTNEELMEYSELLDLVTSKDVYDNGLVTGWLLRWANGNGTYRIGYYIRKNGGFTMEYIQLNGVNIRDFINDKLRIMEIIDIEKEKRQSDINDIFEYRKLETLGIVSEYITNLGHKIQSNISNLVSDASNIGTSVVSGASNIGTTVVSGVKCFGNYCMSFIPSNSNTNISSIPSNLNTNISSIPSNSNTNISSIPSDSNANFASNSNANFAPGYNSGLKKTLLDREQRKQTRKQTYDTLKQRRNAEMIKQQREKRQRTMHARRMDYNQNVDFGKAYDSSAAINLFNRPLTLPNSRSLTRNLSTSSNYSKLDLDSGRETLHHSDYAKINAIIQTPTPANISTAEPYLNKLRTGEYRNNPNTLKLAKELETVYNASKKGGSNCQQQKTRNKKRKSRSTRKSKN